MSYGVEKYEASTAALVDVDWFYSTLLS
jgi:hypothetical protein